MHWTQPMPIPLQVQTLPPGDAGTVRTLDIMARNAKSAVQSDVRVHRITQRIAATTADRIGRLRGIYDFLADSFVYKDDAHGFEQVRTPSDMLDQFEAQGRIAGDCDDMATLGAALILAMGHKAGFTIIRAKPNGPFAHVYPTAFIGRLAIPLDAQERTPIGQDTKGAVDRRHYTID